MKAILIGVACCLFVPLASIYGADAPSLQPPKYLGPPKLEHAITNRAFTGIPSLAVAPKGRLWATWYAGETPGEDANNYVVLSTSNDNGQTWNETLVVDPDASGRVRSFDPELWVSPDGRMFLQPVPKRLCRWRNDPHRQMGRACLLSVRPTFNFLNLQSELKEFREICLRLHVGILLFPYFGF